MVLVLMGADQSSVRLLTLFTLRVASGLTLLRPGSKPTKGQSVGPHAASAKPAAASKPKNRARPTLVPTSPQHRRQWRYRGPEQRRRNCLSPAAPAGRSVLDPSRQRLPPDYTPSVKRRSGGRTL